MNSPRYVAEVSAGDQRRAVSLGGYAAPSRRLALRWLRGQAERIADALDPDPRAPWLSRAPIQRVPLPLPDAPTDLRQWARDPGCQKAALERLALGLPVELLTRDHTGWYCLTARPPRPGRAAHAPTDIRRNVVPPHESRS